MPASIHTSPHLGQALGGRLAYTVLPVVLLVYAIGVLTLPLLPTDEQIAVGLLLLVPALLIAVYVAMRALLGDRACGMLVAVVSIFIISANFRIRAYDDKSIDWQVGIKLVALALLFGMVAVFLVYAFNRLHLGRLFYAWLLFFAWLVASSLYSVSVTFALMSSVSLLGGYLYAVYMTVWLSRMRTVEIMMLVALLMSVGSIFLYFAFPSIGRMQAWLPGAVFGDTGRLKGLTGSANAIGLIAGCAIIFATLYYRELGAFGKRLALALIPSALACLVLSNNRGGMIALAITMWFRFVVRGATTFKVALTIAGALAGGALLVGFSDEIFTMISRSGSSTEITDISGRSSIWAVVIELWTQRPIFGHGFTSGLWILPLDPRLFGVAAHAHNMFLELLFAGGVVLLGLFLYATCQTFLAMYRFGAVNEASVLIFLLIRGLAEAGPFGGMIGYTAFAFSVAIALVISKAIDAHAGSAGTWAPTSMRAAPRLRPSRV